MGSTSNIMAASRYTSKSDYEITTAFCAKKIKDLTNGTSVNGLLPDLTTLRNDLASSARRRRDFLFLFFAWHSCRWVRGIRVLDALVLVVYEGMIYMLGWITIWDERLYDS